jgi:chemotaxis protein histidine kinase CheA
LVDLNKPAPTVRFYRFRNRLKDKTAGLGGDKVITIDEGALAAAEALFEQMAEDYPDWVNAILLKLTELHSRCVDSPENRRGLFEQIRAIAHDLKGQGGTFGYPLITTVATSLDRFVSLRHNIKDSHVEITKAHIDAMRAVIRERIKGDGGEIGAALVKSMDTVIERYKQDI